LVCTKMVSHYADNVHRSRQPSFAVAHGATALELAVIKPAVHEGKVLTAVVDLLVIKPDRPAILQNRDVRFSSVSHPREILCQMNGRVGLVSDAQQEHLTRELVGTADGAIEAVRRVNGVGGCDLFCTRANCGEGVRTVAAEHVRTPPEPFRNDSHLPTGTRPRVKRVIIIPGHTRHHECTIGSQRVAQSGNEAQRSSCDGPDFRECRVHEQDVTRRHAQIDQLTDKDILADNIHVHSLRRTSRSPARMRRAEGGDYPSTVDFIALGPWGALSILSPLV